MTNMVPTFGNEPDPIALQYIRQTDALTQQMLKNGTAKQLAMADMQTEDLGRRGDAYTATLNNADKLVQAVGVAPLLAILNQGVDPSMGMQNPTAAEYGAVYGQEADQLRLMQDYAKGFKDAGQGAAYFVDKVGQMPDLAAMGQRQWPGFSGVPRGSEFGGSGAAKPKKVIDELVIMTDKAGNRLGMVSTSRDPQWLTNLAFTNPQAWELRQRGELVVTPVPLYSDGTYGAHGYVPSGGASPATGTGADYEDGDLPQPRKAVPTTEEDLLGEYERYMQGLE